MRLDKSFFTRDALVVAPELLGASITRKFPDNTEFTDIITEVEVYRGMEDLACHASKGQTPRTAVMFGEGGHIYVYLVYGMYWLINVVTGPAQHPQALLLRCTKTLKGPGVLGKALKIDKSFYGEDIATSTRIKIEKKSTKPLKYETLPRIGVAYAKEWALKPWRFVLLE